MNTPKLTFAELVVELGCTVNQFPGGGLQVLFLTGKNERGQADRRFWDLSDAHVAGTLSGPALHVVLHDDFATLAAGAFLTRRDPAAGAQFDYEEERAALADLIRARFGGLVTLALELFNSGAPLPHNVTGRLSVELARCEARGIRKAGEVEQRAPMQEETREPNDTRPVKFKLGNGDVIHAGLDSCPTGATRVCLWSDNEALAVLPIDGRAARVTTQRQLEQLARD